MPTDFRIWGMKLLSANGNLVIWAFRRHFWLAGYELLTGTFID
jgi:hypothetical protein